MKAKPAHSFLEDPPLLIMTPGLFAVGYFVLWACCTPVDCADCLCQSVGCGLLAGGVMTVVREANATQMEESAPEEIPLLRPDLQTMAATKEEAIGMPDAESEEAFSSSTDPQPTSLVPLLGY